MTQGTEATILVDEFTFDANTSQLAVEFTVGEGDKTNLASTALEYLPLLSVMRITQNGYFDNVATGGFEREMYRRFGTDGVIVSALFGTDSLPCPAYVSPDAFGAQMAFGAPADNIITLDGAWAQTTAGLRGMCLVNTTITATGYRVVRDLGAEGANGYFVVHVQDITGATTGVDIQLLHSEDGEAGWTEFEELTFTAEGASIVAFTEDPVYQYVRVGCDDLGGATSVTFTAIAVVDGVTQNVE